MKNLMILRKNSNLTQRELANKIGISAQLISYYETGKANPSLEAIFKLADFFDCSIDYLLGHQNKSNFNINNLSINKRKAIELISQLDDKDTDFVLELLKKMNKKI